MSIITKMRKQNAVYWGNPVEDGRGGFTFSDAIEIKCRWDDKRQLYINQDGVQSVSNSIVYVDRDVDLNGFLFLGTLDDLDSTNDPTQIAGAGKINNFSKSPNLKATEFLRTAIL